MGVACISQAQLRRAPLFLSRTEIMSNLQQLPVGNSLLAYPAAFIAGLLISFTPCVYPVIPIDKPVGPDHNWLRPTLGS